MNLTDPVALAQALVRVPSVTPDPGAAIGLIGEWLAALGAELHWVHEDPNVPNLVARLGSGRRLAFAGHTDVVPPGDEAAWSRPPFAGEIANGKLYGRGACDMKGGLAAAIAATARTPASERGETWFYVTGDEEGDAVHGTAAIVRWLQGQGFGFDGCIVLEPTSEQVVGDAIKIGRRGSLNARIVVRGVQGHTAFPDRADNPVHRLVAIVQALTAAPLDAGSARFGPSTLQVSTFDVGNPTPNVIPAHAEVALNIRFNTEHTPASLETWLRAVARRHAGDGGTVEIRSVSDAFVTSDRGFAAIVADAIAYTLGRTPRASTGGGTSDARFLKDIGPVIELGTVGHTLHQVDEWVGLDELETLTKALQAVVERVARAS